VTTGLVFDIKKFALHDGPGLRTTVFLKGCPLACAICHNPESQSSAPEIWVRHERCVHCYTCLEICPEKAVSFDGERIGIDRGRCTLCGECARLCTAGAIEIVGREMSVAEVMTELEKDAVFYDESGGGVTFSGGEPLAQPAFLLDLLAACRERGFHAVVDTCGHAPPDVVAAAAELTDLFLFDLKFMDPARHAEYTGVGNELILANLRSLAHGGAGLIVRYPPIPGVNDDETDLRSMGALLSALPGPPPVDLLPYHRIGTTKYDRLERDYLLPDLEPPPPERLEWIVDILSGCGLEVTVRGEKYGVE